MTNPANKTNSVNNYMGLSVTDHAELIEAANRWAAVALDLGWVEQWTEGAIFACEMVYFLARVETEGVRTVIESGRQDGYSTRVLGEFARRTGVRVISIDYEDDPARGLSCRESLRPYPVEALVGDAFSLMGKSLRENVDAPTALLVDGPKGWSADALVFASSAYKNVKVIALHNQQRGAPETCMLLKKISPNAFYEEYLPDSEGSWARLRKHEAAHLSQHAVRSLDRSSLAIFLVRDEIRRRLALTTQRKFMFFQPPLITLFWNLGQYEAARLLHSGSFRIFNSRIFPNFLRP